jgi:hypothetical protein
MGYIKDLIQKNVSGVYVYSVELGSNEVEDQSMGFFANMNDQAPLPSLPRSARHTTTHTTHDAQARD